LFHSADQLTGLPGVRAKVAGGVSVCGRNLLEI